jgi:hypothetical protein
MKNPRFALLAALALVLVLALPGSARADPTPFSQPGRFGLGVSGGYGPSGLTGKLYFANAVAGQLTLGGWYRYGYDVNISAIFEMPNLTRQEFFWINWNLGIGADLGVFDAGTGIGVTGIIGLGFQLTHVPLEFVAEWRPTFFPGYGGFYPHSGASIRYFF